MAGFAPIYNPVVPFQSAILGGISDGKRVTIQGQVHSHAKRCAIDFVSFNNDIAFHFNPRFDECVIVCNTMQSHSWGAEERKNHMPFQRNAFFDISIAVVGHAFQVTANGQFLLEYRHRMSYQNIQSIKVSGDVSLSCVTFHPSPAEMTPAPPPYTPYAAQPVFSAHMAQPVFSAHMIHVNHDGQRPPTHQKKKYMTQANTTKPAELSPQNDSSDPNVNKEVDQPQKGPTVVHNPVMPFQAAFPKSNANNRCIVITGMVHYGADRFHVNLLNSRTRNIHLQINPRFNEGTIVRNTQDRGTWGPEERQLSYMPFYQGQNFQMEIRNEGGVLGIYSNGAKLFNYVHRLPSNQIDMMEIGGNINLTCVQY
ncbi:PREDICTED: galectin-8-like [Nanorana parkeri]|uniref:galectin-8-like n=1 Tax=Nanorana parkeri TaxID=125878 RepID=UPI000854578A|nr:PREDICTED: galectin-8-like [Nanorana parkeri]